MKFEFILCEDGYDSIVASLFGCLSSFFLINLKISDYAMPKETVIVGDERGRFLDQAGDELRNFCGSAKYFTDAVALTFVRDRNNPRGTLFTY